MILQVDNTIDTFSIGNSNTIKGTIDTNKVGKMFQLLSNLYSDKESIVLQEITANAQDSYKRINKEGEVLIKFDSSDRSLHIIDKAEGISPYVFENYITKLGSSSKENEDTSAGMLGIGFFSGWCITNCIYLTTVSNGKRYIYTCTKRDYEEPEFNLLLEEDTEEENGTDYWFYLPKSLYSYKDTEKEKFEKALNKLRYFYNVTVEGLNFKNDYKIYQGKTFIFNEDYCKNLYDKDYKELEICFGNTPYPINWDKIEMSKITLPVALKFELNEPLMILPSREALGWNNTTIECVKNKILDFVKEISEIYNQQNQPFDNILDYLKAKDNYQKVKIGDTLINISSLKLKSNITYSKIQHLDLKVPVKIDDIFPLFAFKWNKDYNKKYKPSLYDNKYFYYSEQGLKKNKTSQIRYDCIVQPVQHDLEYSLYYRYFFDCYNHLLPNKNLPENADEQINEFYKYVNEDLKERFLDYDSIIPAKRIVNVVKRTNQIYIAAFNGDTKKEDYNINRFISPKYLFITDNKDEYNRILNYTRPFIKKTKDGKCNIIDVIYTAKKYHHLFDSCNIITLEEWFKSDMFISAFRRNIQHFNFDKIHSHYFFNWLKVYNKRLYYIYKNGNNSFNYYYPIIQKGLELNIPYIDNYKELREVKEVYNLKTETDEMYKRKKIIEFLRSKLERCKKK